MIPCTKSGHDEVPQKDCTSCMQAMPDCSDYEPVPFQFMNLSPIKSCKNWKELNAKCASCLRELNEVWSLCTCDI